MCYILTVHEYFDDIRILAIGGSNISHLANDNEQTTERDIESLGLAYYSNRWHLIACCRLRQDYRDFRTDRIKKIDLLTEIFDPWNNAIAIIYNPHFKLSE